MKIVVAALAACCLISAATIYSQLPLPSATAIPSVTPAPSPSPSVAPSPPPLPDAGSPTASIQFSDGSILPVFSRNGQFPLVGSAPGQTMTILCRVPAALASELVIQSLDGGVASDPSPVSLDGITVFQFQTATQPGLYRVLVIVGDTPATLQFWVPIPDGDNPPVLTTQGGAQ